jgi:hypothetical protein
MNKDKEVKKNVKAIFLSMCDVKVFLTFTYKSIHKDTIHTEQCNDEDVISWNCRLEDIIGRARDMRAMHPSEEKRMLHDILWNAINVQTSIYIYI